MIIADISYEIIFLLFCAAVAAGFIDSIAGGGGMVSVSALLLAGLSPNVALATNKMQSVVGVFTAACYYTRKGLVDLAALRLPIIITLLASALGSFSLLQIDTQALEYTVPVLLIGVGCYFLCSGKIGAVQRTGDKRPQKHLIWRLLACAGIGFYDGIFGPGTGSFFTLAFFSVFALPLTNSVANTKVLNFVSNISALCYFLAYGSVAVNIGIAMILGQIVGASLGARLVVRKGTRIVRPLIIGSCFLMAGYLLLQGLQVLP